MWAWWTLGVGAAGMAVAALVLVPWLRTRWEEAHRVLLPFTKASDAVTYASYGGSQSCRECHAEAFKLWEHSHHALAERAVNAAMDQPAFEPARSFKIASVTSEARVSDGKFEIVTVGLGKERKPFPIDRIIGENPLRQGLVAAPGGRWQTTELAFDPNKGDWFDIFGNEDRQPGEWGHWTGRGMTWNSMCASCHNTRLRKNYDAGEDGYKTAMAERAVGCEACHGPMADHNLWQKQHAGKKGDPTIRKLDQNQMMSVCGGCHARRADLTGDFRPGDAFLDHYSPTIPDETDIYYPDGQVRDEDYEYISFLSSRMNSRGVRCTDCHQPHSMKPLAEGNALCLRCHGPPLMPAPKIVPEAHSHHDPAKAGNLCTDCHMPQTVYMQRHWRHDHGLTIPDPLLTKQHGVPNACNRCHKDKSTDWAIEAAEKWYGKRMERPTRTRAFALAEARAGQRPAADKLVELLRTEKSPMWRAVESTMLKRWCNEPAIIAALLKRAGDNNPLVRLMAARSLEPLALNATPEVSHTLTALLRDPVRAVRVEAAWALRATIDPQSVAGSDLMHYLEGNADQPGGLMQLGVYHLDRGELEVALSHFQRTVVWDAGSAPLYHALAVALSMQGKTADAAQALQTACRLAPREAEYRFKLGLALNELGKLKEAAAALEEAVKLDPQFAQAWYNLGLAYSALEQPQRAVDALTRGESCAGASAQISYARATILARMGRTAEARIAARRALEIQPSHHDAAELLQTLSR